MSGLHQSELQLRTAFNSEHNIAEPASRNASHATADVADDVADDCAADADEITADNDLLSSNDGAEFFAPDDPIR